jgi:hypothetical protein
LAEYARLANSSAANSPNMDSTRRPLKENAYQMKRYADEPIMEQYRNQANPTSR